MEHFRDLDQQVVIRSHNTNLLPVAMETSILDGLASDRQCLRWDKWNSEDEAREQRLIREIALTLAIMLRQYLSMLNRPGGNPPELEQYLEKIQIFLSHTKRDKDGEKIAERMRIWLQKNSALSSFLDIYDIPWGRAFLRSH